MERPKIKSQNKSQKPKAKNEQASPIRFYSLNTHLTHLRRKKRTVTNSQNNVQIIYMNSRSAVTLAKIAQKSNRRAVTKYKIFKENKI
jgi:hypothetical protein